MQRQNASQYDIIYSVAFVQKEQIFHIKYMDEECSVGGGEFRSFQGKNPNPAARPISEPAEEKKGDILSSLEVNKQRPRLIESAALCS